MTEEIVYPIEGEKEENRAISIKAGIKWSDKNRIIRYEGIMLDVPKEVRNNKKTCFCSFGNWKRQETRHI